MLHVLRIVIGLVTLLALGCQKKATNHASASWQEGKVRVVATTTMLADLCRVIGGDAVHVVGLMGPEQDPHSYVSRAGDTKLMAEARVIVANGLRLEGKMVDRLAANAQKDRSILLVGERLPEEQLLAPQEEFDGVKDPHIWGDVSLWKQAANLVAGVFSDADPAHAADYAGRAKEYGESLTTLDGWIREQVEKVEKSKRVLVTGHDAFFYFGKAYGFQVRGVRGVSSAVESDLRQNQELARFMRESGVRTIFAESTVNGKEVQAVAQQAGASVSGAALYSDALGADGEAATYIGMMRHNVRAIVEGLQ